MTTEAPLSAAAFIAVWVVSAIVCTLLAGRWKYAAIAMAGIAGYSTFALAISVIVHPSLVTRIVIVSVFIPTGTICCLLPLQKYQHACLRLATSSAGAFGLIVTIALFAGVSAWSNVWERLWVSNGSDGWSSPQEKGLSGGYCLFMSLGVLCDWLLHNKLGENPDQKWDSYLANYTNTLPNEPGRAGTFTPLTSFWSRHFGYKGMDPIAKEVIYPTDADLKLSPPSPTLPKKHPSLFALSSHSRVFKPPRRPEILRKQKKDKALIPGFKRTRQAIKFSPLDVDDLSSSDDDEDSLKKTSVHMHAHQLPSSQSNSTATLVDETIQNRSTGAEHLDLAKETEKVKTAMKGYLDREAPDYSDYEEDVTVSATRNRIPRDAPGWAPPFLQRHSSPALAPRHAMAPYGILRPSFASAHSAPAVSPDVPLTSVPVPATPSLIRAIDRISQAQQAAYARWPSDDAGLPPPSDKPEIPRHSGGWQSFWRDVKARAAHDHLDTQ